MRKILIFIFTILLFFSIKPIHANQGNQDDYKSRENEIEVINKTIKNEIAINGKEVIGTWNEVYEFNYNSSSSNNDLSSVYIIFCFVFPVLCSIITLILWFLFGKDEKIIETVEFYPPEGFNSAEVGFLYRGESNIYDVFSLFTYMNYRGFIDIEENKEDFKDIKITKIKDYTGDNKIEKLFMKALFEVKPENESLNSNLNEIELRREIRKNVKSLLFDSTDTNQMQDKESQELVDDENVSYRDIVTPGELQGSFYKTLYSIMAQLNSKANKETLYVKSSLNKNYYVAAMILICFFVISGISTSDLGIIGGVFQVLPTLITAFGMTLVVMTFFGKVSGQSYAESGKFAGQKGVKLMTYLIGGAFWLFGFISSSSGLFLNPTALLAYLWGTVNIFIMMTLMQYMTKRTKYGGELLGKIRGFRNFLTTAEKEKIEILVEENPNYFYDILPFAYVLDVTDKWISRFSTISITPSELQEKLTNNLAGLEFANYVYLEYVEANKNKTTIFKE